MSLSFPEITLIIGLVFLMGLECFKAVQSGSWVQVYRPTLFIAVFLSFYALVGPLRALLAEGEVARCFSFLWIFAFRFLYPITIAAPCSNYIEIKLGQSEAQWVFALLARFWGLFNS
jgi:small basic protein